MTKLRNLHNLIFPYSSRPWNKHDVRPHVPHMNEKRYVDFKPGDEEDPRNWSISRKWYITLAAIFLAFNGAFSSSVPSGSATSIAKEFDVSEVAVSLSVTLFVLGYCVGPFFLSPLTEFYGRRWMIYTTWGLYMALGFLTAFAPNFAAFLISRFLAGTAVSAPLCAAPGVLADLWDQYDRGDAMAIFSFSVWAGPCLGPVVGAFLDEAKGWRWGFYFVLWMGGLATLLMFSIPETHIPTILAAKAGRMRELQIPGYENTKAEIEDRGKGILETYKEALILPWTLLLDLISLLCAIYLAIIFMLQYMLFSIYPIVFGEIRGWSTSMAQLPILGSVVGVVVGMFILFYNTRRRRKTHYAGGPLEPEDNLNLAMIGGVGFPVTMFWFAWTGQYSSVHWFVPTLAGAVLSTSLMLVFVPVLNYLVESYSFYAASLVAVNTFARSVGSAAAPLFTDFMFGALGVGGGGSLIGGAAAVLAVIPFLFARYGKRLRVKSRYAPTPFEEASANSSGTLAEEGEKGDNAV